MRRVLLFLISGTLVLRAADPPGEPRTHTVFMGADFAVEREGKAYRIEDVEGSSFVVLVDGRQERVPTQGGQLSISIARSLKLTATLTQLSRLRWERTYAPGTNPEERAATAYANLVGNVMDEVAMMQGETAAPLGMPATSLTLPGALQDQRNEIYSSTAYTESVADAAANDRRNAIHVEFDLQANRPMPHAYMILVGVFRLPDRPRAHLQWVGARALEPLDGSSPLHVDLVQAGFPAGFRVERLAVHLFERGGVEVATSQSDDRVALTREEAFQYMVIDYLTSHAGATLPAQPAMAAPPVDWERRRAAAEFGQTYFVRIDRTGHPRGLFADPLCRKAVTDAYLRTAVMQVRFCPALQSGLPVDTVAPIVPRVLLE